MNQFNANSRRQFLTQSLRVAAGVAAIAGSGDLLAGTTKNSLADGDWKAVPKNNVATKALPAEPKQAEPPRRLRLVNAHTWEKLDLVYWAENEYLQPSIDQLNHLLRDHRAGVSFDMDFKLFDYLHSLYKNLDTDQRVHILSGYRTPATNARLRKRSNGVAKNSLHMSGRALDINIPSIKTSHVQKTALKMQRGGVGYYAKAGFVHIDTGNFRHWERG